MATKAKGRSGSNLIGFLWHPIGRGYLVDPHLLSSSSWNAARSKLGRRNTIPGEGAIRNAHLSGFVHPLPANSLTTRSTLGRSNKLLGSKVAKSCRNFGSGNISKPGDCEGDILTLHCMRHTMKHQSGRLKIGDPGNWEESHLKGWPTAMLANI